MRKIIWTCWFQGRANAPYLVERCLRSWERENPDWDVRCLDAESLSRFIDLKEYIDLDRHQITAASLSDVLRILLLHEYGGAWVDATLFCNRPLSSWLPQEMTSGFFAFANPAPDRLLSSWFLAADHGNRIVAKWAARTIDYWAHRERSKDYFWFHHEFGNLYAEDADFRTQWDQTPHYSADGPHSLVVYGWAGRYEDAARVAADTAMPMFKLSHRLDADTLGAAAELIDSLLRQGGDVHKPAPLPPEAISPPTPFVGLSTKTENLGDHIQILAAERLLGRAGVTVERRLDRDDDIATNPPIDELDTPIGILLNGWFKTNPAEWPPHASFAPLYLGFHIRLFQAPSLVSSEALEHYRANGPIGCRDDYTLKLLRENGVEVFLSNCLTLILPRRLHRPLTQTETLVVSRDQRLVERVPGKVGPVRFICHYSGTSDFEANTRSAEDLLTLYRDHARLVVTDLLHCALPCLAMGVPVVVFYPPNEEPMRQSDRERFSTLSSMVRVHEPNDTAGANWAGELIDASKWKLDLIDAFFKYAQRWQLPPPASVGPIAAPEILPVPSS